MASILHDTALLLVPAIIIPEKMITCEVGILAGPVNNVFTV
jgi:hypothetical protein